MGSDVILPASSITGRDFVMSAIAVLMDEELPSVEGDAVLSLDFGIVQSRTNVMGKVTFPVMGWDRQHSLRKPGIQLLLNCNDYWPLAQKTTQSKS